MKEPSSSRAQRAAGHVVHQNGGEGVVLGVGVVAEHAGQSVHGEERVLRGVVGVGHGHGGVVDGGDGEEGVVGIEEEAGVGGREGDGLRPAPVAVRER